MEVIDDFLNIKELYTLQEYLMEKNEVQLSGRSNLTVELLPWFYNDTIDYNDDEGNHKYFQFQFIHSFYRQCIPVSSNLSILNSILNKIHPIAIFRIKANLLTRTPNIIENSFHVDMKGMSEEKLKQWTTSIFYINTNNGYTKFEDGTKVESVANRLVTFPANLKHHGTTCTDEKTRIVINFNYFLP